MTKRVVLLMVGVFAGLLFLSSCTEGDISARDISARDISVSAGVTAYCPQTTIVAEGTFTFNPDEIIPEPEDTEDGCRPVGVYSPVFGDNEEIQLTISALKCGPGPLYYSFTLKYYGLYISHVISHEKLEMIKEFRIQLDSGKNQIETPAGKRDVIYFEGKLLKSKIKKGSE